MINFPKLEFSSGRNSLSGLSPVNQELMKIGVRVSILPLIEESLEILTLSTAKDYSLICQD